ncbi:MAG TPA: AAA family ATPase [Mycobacteriales bacterium]|nr:AAA family ATPase [Mycobacteriales bacterium]
MSDSPLVVVLDRTDALVRSLAKAVDLLEVPADVQLFTRAAEVDAVFDEDPVEVLLVGPSELTTTGLKRVARWHADNPATVVVLAAEKDRLPDPALVVKAGAEVLLRLPAGPAAVRRVLANALDVAASRREALATTVLVTDVEPEPEQPEDELEEVLEEVADVPREPAITITVASATGGCGKTFLATNLAFLLAAGSGRTVAMIDLDVQFGELVPTLQLKPHSSLADVVLDEEGHADLTGLLTHHESGFDVLAAPPDPVAADRIGHGVVRASLEALRASYDYVIIDTPPSLNEVVLDAFDVSDHLVVLATLDIPSVRNMRVFLSTLERLRIRQDGVHLVLNKAERGVGLVSGDIQRLLGRTWDLELPYDREVSRSVNLGLPVSECSPSSEVSKRLIAGVTTLVPGADVQLGETEAAPTGLARLLGAFRRRHTPLVMKEKTP